MVIIGAPKPVKKYESIAVSKFWAKKRTKIPNAQNATPETNKYLGLNLSEMALTTKPIIRPKDAEINERVVAIPIETLNDAAIST